MDKKVKSAKQEDIEQMDFINKIAEAVVQKMLEIQREKQRKRFEQIEKQANKIKNDKKEKKIYIKKVKKYLDDYYCLKYEVLENLEQISELEFNSDITKSKEESKQYCVFIEEVLKSYLEKLSERENDRIKKDKINVVENVYLKGMSKKDFAKKFYNNDLRTLRRKITKIAEDLLPYFFGIIGMA